MRKSLFRVSLIVLLLATASPPSFSQDYFPPPEAEGGWRALVGANEPPSVQQKESIRTVAGVDHDLLREAWDYSSKFKTMNSLLVIRRGWIVGEWRNFDHPHDLASCTKSLTALAFAKLFDLSERGAIPVRIAEESFAYEFLPARWGDEEPARKKVRLRHLLTMSSGLEPYDGPYRNNYGEIVNTRSVESPPGSSWAYSSSEVDLLSVILERVSGRNLAEFFFEEIASPIGAPEFDWATFGIAGHPAGSGGPRGGARPPIRDLARIGYLALREGLWGRSQVISRGRVKRYTSWAPHLQNAVVREPNFWLAAPGGQHSYGYLWWTNRTHSALGPEVPADAFFMSGWGMRGCFVVPSLDLVVVRLGGDGQMNKLREFYRELMTRVVASVRDPRMLASASE